MELVGQPDRVLRVDFLRPVDARLGIPLLVLSLLVQGKEPGAPLVVLPREARVAGAGDLPRGRRGRVRAPAATGTDARRDRSARTGLRRTFRRPSPFLAVAHVVADR